MGKQTLMGTSVTECSTPVLLNDVSTTYDAQCLDGVSVAEYGASVLRFSTLKWIKI